jgi:DNA ligase D-like protein (predicted 3'-phosphoesterase)
MKEYSRKRYFTKTPEPSGRETSKGNMPIFVIQKHAATRLHYDFRIEMDGILKSWAVPKGPSTDPRVKRLAIPTEDHPLDYADFEGVIPEDEYGAGTVMIWDHGTYKNIKEDEDGKEVPIRKCLERGHIEIDLKGKKIEGGYSIVRTEKGSKPRWLLVKMKDDGADARRNPVSTQPKSSLTGRTLRQIEEEEKDNHGR